MKLFARKFLNLLSPCFLLEMYEQLHNNINVIITENMLNLNFLLSEMDKLAFQKWTIYKLNKTLLQRIFSDEEDTLFDILMHFFFLFCL